MATALQTTLPMTKSKNAKRSSVADARKEEERIIRSALRDGPGVQCSIDKNIIKIDHEYQRPLNTNKIATMRKSGFSYVMFGSLTLAQRATGDYYSVDGQHRHALSLLFPDIKKVPCVVFEFESREAEAAAFVALNRLRQLLNAAGQFRAKVFSGDPVATFVNSLIESAGYRVGASAKNRTVRCLRCLDDCAKLDRDTLSKIWPLIVEVSADGPIQERVVEPIFYVERRLKNQSLLAKPWRDRVLNLGVKGIVEAGILASEYHRSRGGERIWAMGLVNALNHGCRHRLVVPGLHDED